MTLLKTLPVGEKAREIDTLALSELIERGLHESKTAGYFQSKRGGYVYISTTAAAILRAFVDDIKADAEKHNYDFADATKQGCFMLWRHSNEKARNRELFYRYAFHPPVEKHIPVVDLQLP
ncbi:hypothetical protein AVA65_07750 [Salmonella enterica subsp. enterica serovar Minnesota]|nr:hypothetical protein [Salmonella enterica subsp. enterica serovar Minnesota]